MLNSSQTHLPTTSAWPQISGISFFMRSSRARVFLIFALSSFTVTLSLPSTRLCGLLLVWLLSLEARTALLQQEFFPSLGQSISCHLAVMILLFDEDKIRVGTTCGERMI